MSHNRYVLLTGGKNNAGDFLIGHRAKSLLSALRPDRELLEFNAWEPFDNERLQAVNESKALILTGGPSLQTHMMGKIYPLTPNLEDIQVPILLMGSGWKSKDGSWEATHTYKLSDATMNLLQHIERHGLLSSVRDYHTLNMLNSRGFKNVLMTGCPALYSLPHLNQPMILPESIRRVSFSLGVAGAQSPSMDKLMKDLILTLQAWCKDKQLQVVFHHTLDQAMFETSYGALNPLFDYQQQFAAWLTQQQIDYVDIAGSVSAMLDHYEYTDLHVGFRVHAHILMSSVSKPSILFAEDGRGKALKDVLGGRILDGYTQLRPAFRTERKWLRQIKVPNDPYKATQHLAQDLLPILTYELSQDSTLLCAPRHHIDQHYQVMKRFIDQLP